MKPRQTSFCSFSAFCRAAWVVCTSGKRKTGRKFRQRPENQPKKKTPRLGWKIALFGRIPMSLKMCCFFPLRFWDSKFCWTPNLVREGLLLVAKKKIPSADIFHVPWSEKSSPNPTCKVPILSENDDVCSKMFKRVCKNHILLGCSNMLWC